jgi:hypothetical protein
MSKAIKKFSYLSTLLIFSIYACSSETTLKQPNDSLNTTLPQIVTKLDEINSKIDKLEKAKASVKPSVAPTKKPTTSSSPITSSAKPSSSPTSTPKPSSGSSVTPSATPKPSTTETPKEKGRKIMNSVIDRINNAGAIEADVDKSEKDLKGGTTNAYTLKFYARKTKEVKIEVVAGKNVGTKLMYTSGDNGKVKVRPAGLLSVVTTDLDKTDDRIANINGYPLDETDFFGMTKRFTNTDYEAEVIGSSKVNGEDVYVLKIINSKGNTLDSRIKFEYIYFEPSTFNIRGWEAYADSETEPYFKLTLKTFKLLDSLADSIFKV